MTNNGTGEHIFNQASVFEWMHALCKSGGVMLHLLPMKGWLNHGFYNYNPVLFRDLAQANKYDILGMYLGERNGRLERVLTDVFHSPEIHREPESELEKQIASFGDRANVMFCIVLRKVNDDSFQRPKHEEDERGQEAHEAQKFHMLMGQNIEIVEDPFPHFILDPAIPSDMYEALRKEWPEFPGRDENNVLDITGAAKALYSDATGSKWRTFMLSHLQTEWLTAITQAFERYLAPVMTQLGSELQFGVRGTGKFDLQSDVQFGVNSPVKTISRVRGPHVDSADQILQGLFYVPEPDDDAGGDLILYRWKGGDRYLYGKAEVPDDLVEEAVRVPYKPNTAIFWVTTKDAVHGVAPRKPTDKKRRYVSLVLSAGKDVVERYEHRDVDTSMLRGDHQ